MPDIETMRANVAAAEKRIATVEAVPAGRRTAKQNASLATNRKSLARHQAALATAAQRNTSATAFEAPPPDTGSNRQSAGIYTEWALRRYGTSITPPVEGTPDELRALAAAGRLGNPLAPHQDGIDWSLYTAVVGETTGTGLTYHAYLRGREVAVEDGGGDFDTAAFAERNGIDPN